MRRRLPLLINVGLILAVLTSPVLGGYAGILLVITGGLILMDIWQELNALP